MQDRPESATRDLNEALPELLASLRPRLEQILWHYGIPDHEAEDLIQEVLLSLVRRYDKVEDPEAWISCALKYQCRQYWHRYRKRLYETVDQSLLEIFARRQPSVSTRYDQVLDVKTVLARIPKRCRRILQLRYWEGLSPKELASKLGYKHSSVSNIVRRCLSVFSKQLLAAPIFEAIDGV